MPIPPDTRAPGDAGHVGDHNNIADELTALVAADATETARALAAEALLAPKASPALTGTPTAPTATALTSTTQVATTAYADSAVTDEANRATAAEALKAPLASPALTGSPTAPTQTAGDSSTKLATTAFVAGALPNVPYYDAVVFGADPTGAADSTSAIKAARDACLGLRTDTNVGYTATSTTVTDPAAVSGDNGQYITSQNFPRSDTGCSTSSTTAVTDPSANLADLGCTITGTGIPSSTTITAVTPGAGYTISNAATATASGLTFTVIGGAGGYAQITAVTPGVGYTVSVAATATLAAQTAAVGTAAALVSRLAKAALYLRPGIFKITSDLNIRSSQGFKILGAGPGMTRLMPSGAAFKAAVVYVDGSLDGVFAGFTIQGDGTEQVTDAIRLDWTTLASRSTTANCFRDIRILGTKFVTGLSLESNGSRQCDGTTLENIVITGGQTPGSWSGSGNWQKGIALGSGTFSNIYDTRALGVDVALCNYGWYCNASGFSLNGSQPAGNGVDFYVVPGAQTTITNIQSQDSGQFLTQAATFNPNPISVSDVYFISTHVVSPWNIIDVFGGKFCIKNFTADVISGGSFVDSFIKIRGDGTNRPGIVTLDNVTLHAAFASAIAVTSGQAYAVVSNYSQYDPVAGTYTVTPLEFYNGTAWVTPGASATPAAPDIQWYTTVGTATWTRPAGAVTTEAFVMSGGAGGGSGRRGAAGTVRCGGGGGAGAALAYRKFVTADLTSTVTVTVGDGGAGGAAVTTDDTSGANGSLGGSTSFGTYLAGPLVTGGLGGTAAAGSGGTGILGGPGNAGAGGSASTTGGAGVGSNPGALGAPGAPSGGGITSGDVAGAGTPGTYSYLGGTSSSTYGATAPVVDTTTPTSGTSSGVKGTPGGSPGSGSASKTTAAQAGADAYANSGAGGAGGGASLNGNNSGKGGKGGSGFVLVVSFFQ